MNRRGFLRSALLGTSAIALARNVDAAVAPPPRDSVGLYDTEGNWINPATRDDQEAMMALLGKFTFDESGNLKTAGSGASTVTANQGGAWNVGVSGTVPVSNASLNSILAQFDSKTSTLATQSTLAGIKTQTDKFTFDGSNILQTSAGSPDVTDRAARLLGIIYGNAGMLQQRANSLDLFTALRYAGTEIDPRNIRALDSGIDSVATAPASPDPTYLAYADNVAFAANKQHISIFNGAGSGVVVKLKALYPVDLALAAVTGVAVRFDYKLITALSAGTAVTPIPHDSTNPSLPAQVLVKTGGTATEGSILYPMTMANDEVGATQAFPSSLLMQSFNWLSAQGYEVGIQDRTLREGQGVTVKQVTNTTVGTFGWVLVFTAA